MFLQRQLFGISFCLGCLAWSCFASPVRLSCTCQVICPARDLIVVVVDSIVVVVDSIVDVIGSIVVVVDRIVVFRI